MEQIEQRKIDGLWLTVVGIAVFFSIALPFSNQSEEDGFLIMAVVERVPPIAKYCYLSL